MISSFVLSLIPLEDGKEIKKYKLFDEFYYFFKNNGIEGEELKTITVSNFFTKDKTISIDKKYSFKITSIDSSTTLKLLQIFFYKRLTSEKIKLFDTNFLIFNIYHNNKYSKIFDVENFFTKSFSNEVNVNFLSPTFFKVGNNYKILKEPKYIFKNLLKKLSKSSLKNEIEFSKDLDLSKIKVRENFYKEVNISQYKTIGFIGNFDYYIDDVDEELIFLMNFLLYFSFFSGIGYGCERGYGQAETNIVIEDKIK